MFIYTEKSTWSLTSFLRYYTVKNSAIWLAESILDYEFYELWALWILPDKGFAVKYTQQYDFSF